MKQISISKKNVIISFVLFLFNAILLEIAGKLLATYSDLPKLDFRLGGYNTSDVSYYLTTLGDPGRSVYFTINLIDIPFPFLLSLFSFYYFSYTWKKWNIKTIYIFLITSALSFLVFDTLENGFIYLLLTNYPVLNSSIICIATVSTQIKLFSLIVIYTFLPITFIFSLIKNNRKNV